MYLENLKKIYKKKVEKQEQLRKKVLKEALLALKKLSEHVKFESAYIFGSVVKPYKFKPDSDVDFAFVRLEKDKLFYTIAFLSNFLERDVDVLEFEKIRKIPFKEKILKEGVKWKND